VVGIEVEYTVLRYSHYRISFARMEREEAPVDMSFDMKTPLVRPTALKASVPANYPSPDINVFRTPWAGSSFAPDSFSGPGATGSAPDSVFKTPLFQQSPFFPSNLNSAFGMATPSGQGPSASSAASFTSPFFRTPITPFIATGSSVSAAAAAAASTSSVSKKTSSGLPALDDMMGASAPQNFSLLHRMKMYQHNSSLLLSEQHPTITLGSSSKTSSRDGDSIGAIPFPPALDKDSASAQSSPSIDPHSSLLGPGAIDREMIPLFSDSGSMGGLGGPFGVSKTKRAPSPILGQASVSVFKYSVLMFPRKNRLQRQARAAISARVVKKKQVYRTA